MLPVLEEFGVTVLEQPLPPDRARRPRARSAGGRDIPVIADESCKTRRRHPAAGGQGGRHQHQAGQVRQPARGAPDDRDRAGARHDGDGGLHDRELASASPRPRTSRRWWTSWTSTAPRCSPTIRSSVPRIDGGQVTLPDRARASASGGDDRRASPASPSPSRSPPRTPTAFPRRWRDRVVPGARVVVPVRRRELIGIVVELDATAPDGRGARRPRRPGSGARAPAGAARDRARGWRATTARRSASRLSAMLPAGHVGRVAGRRCRWSRARAPSGGRGRRGASTGSSERGGEAPVCRRGAGAQATGVGRGGPAGAGRRASTLRVVPPDTERGAAHRARASRCTGEPPTLLERDTLLRAARASSARSTRRSSRSAAAPWCAHVVDQLGLQRGGDPRRSCDAGSRGSSSAERVRDPFADCRAVPAAGRRSRRPSRRRWRRSSGSSPARARCCFGRDRQRQDAGLPRGGAARRWPRARGAIVLVPEIGLTPQTVSRLRGAFGDQVAVLHSGLSDGERADAWRLLRRGERRVAVGARSAIFAPVADLGHHRRGRGARGELQERRGAALPRPRRGRGAGPARGRARWCSAAPRRRWRRWSRAGDGPPAAAAARAHRRAAAAAGRAGGPPRRRRKVRGHRRRSPGRRRSTRRSCATLARGEQALLLLNRRGYAAFLQCPDCGEVLAVSRLQHLAHGAPRARRAPLPLLRSRGAAAVHLPRSAPTRCSRCAASAPSSSSGCWPSAIPRRGSRGWISTRRARKWSHQRILGAVEPGEVDLLLGTQMIAKGLDFPNVTLVGRGGCRHRRCYLPDFRVGGAHLPAAGAGRGPGRPRDRRAGGCSCRRGTRRITRWSGGRAHDTEGFLARGAATCAASPPYPPETSLVNLVVSGADEARRLARRARELADWCTRLVARHALPMTVLGPAPCPLARIKDRWRWHVLLKGQPEALGRIVRYAARRLPRPAGCAVVDRSGSGVAALRTVNAGRIDLTALLDLQPDTRSPSRCRPPAAATARTPGRTAPLSVTDPMYCRSHRLFTPRNGAELQAARRRPASRAAGWSRPRPTSPRSDRCSRRRRRPTS